MQKGISDLDDPMTLANKAMSTLNDNGQALFLRGLGIDPAGKTPKQALAEHIDAKMPKAAPGMSRSNLKGSGDFKPMKTGDEQNAFVKKLGVTQSYLSSGNVEQNNLVCQALFCLKNLGYPMPKVLVCGKTYFDDPGRKLTGGLYGPVNDLGVGIAINASNGMNDPKSGVMDYQYSKGWMTTKDPLHTVVHEMGHLLHDASVSSAGGGNILVKDDRKKFDDHFNKTVATMNPDAAAQISKYGRTQAVEFIAEAFAGMTLGKKYHPELVALYKSLKGPEIK